MWCHIRPLLLPFIRLCPQISRRRNVKTDPFNSKQCWNRVWSTELSVATLFWQLSTLGTFMATIWTPSIQFVTCTPAMLRILSNVFNKCFRLPAPWCILLCDVANLCIGRFPDACTVVHFNFGWPLNRTHFYYTIVYHSRPVLFHGRCGWCWRNDLLLISRQSRLQHSCWF